MSEPIEVNTGEVTVAEGPAVLCSNAIGSCVVVTVCDARKKIGALAHIMLPGESPANDAELSRTRYALDAITAMLDAIAVKGGARKDIEVCLVGGANVLQRHDDTIGKDIAFSIAGILRKQNIPISAAALGGIHRRSVRLDVEKGTVSCCEGDGAEQILWRTGENAREIIYDGISLTSRIAGTATSVSKSTEARTRENTPEAIEDDSHSYKGDERVSERAESESARQVMLNIIEDLENNKKELEASKRAYLNILEDMETKNKELEETQRALLNLMQDANDARRKTEELNEKLEEKVEERTRELRESTAQLVQAEKLTALGELSASIAHELNQPLNGIKIICQSILRDIQKKQFDEGALASDLRDVIGQVNKMGEIVDHMGRYTRHTEGSIREMVDINEMIHEALRFLKQQFHSHGIMVSKELCIDLPRVNGDPIRLEQVIMNMLSNARYAVENAGKTQKSIILRTQKGADVSDNHAHSVIIEVEDNGIGIADEAKAKIFKPFFTTKKAGQGTGLGLHISRKIIEEHGGAIEVDSRRGEWTRFRIVLPAGERK
jgi:C4-dicarboxylate-specific signal transduction histidine kinase/chemotaxis receptor (MCP) glutamine deamidase CheD